MVVDGSGNLYFAIEPWASSLVFGSTNVLAYDVNGTY